MEPAAGQGTFFHLPRSQEESFFVGEHNLGVLRGCSPINLVEILFLHYSSVYWEFLRKDDSWEFLRKDDSQVGDVKYVFMRPCIPSETNKSYI